jgi:hypothetical protein
MWCNPRLKRTILRSVPSDWATQAIGHELTVLYEIDHARIGNYVPVRITAPVFETKDKLCVWRTRFAPPPGNRGGAGRRTTMGYAAAPRSQRARQLILSKTCSVPVVRLLITRKVPAETSHHLFASPYNTARKSRSAIPVQTVSSVRARSYHATRWRFNPGKMYLSNLFFWIRILLITSILSECTVYFITNEQYRVICL